jgi:hypothetical protein
MAPHYRTEAGNPSTSRRTIGGLFLVELSALIPAVANTVLVLG